MLTLAVLREGSVESFGSLKHLNRFIHAFDWRAMHESQQDQTARLLAVPVRREHGMTTLVLLKRAQVLVKIKCRPNAISSIGVPIQDGHV